jgi:hypothetical protein
MEKIASEAPARKEINQEHQWQHRDEDEAVE